MPIIRPDEQITWPTIRPDEQITWPTIRPIELPDLSNFVRITRETPPVSPIPEPEPEQLIPASSERPRDTTPARRRKKSGCCGSRPSKEED